MPRLSIVAVAVASVLYAATMDAAAASAAVVATDSSSSSYHWKAGQMAFSSDRCTAIALGKGATADGSTMTTHTADCAECDWRMNRVPPRDWPEGTQRPVYLVTSAYPRFVREDRGTTWSVSNLEQIEGLTDKWKQMTGEIIGYIPQVPHTYGLLEGIYGVMNDQQVAIGESTCAGKFIAVPRGSNGGKALLDISELTQLAMERGGSAREAIRVMGSLSEQYGYYGSEWHVDGPFGADMALGEAGEALTVSDPNEAFMFHILPDPTGESSIWVAQRIPDGHISIAANTFVIGEIDPDSTDFLFSKSVYSVAEEKGWYDPKAGKKLNFKMTYGPPRYRPDYSNRRVWRVFDLAAPSLHLPSTPKDPMATDYPFSVAVEKKMTPQDVMRLQRDHYEGSVFDMTKGLAAGPYGDPNRYDVWSSANLTLRQALDGEYPRAISLFRTSYSFVAQGRSYVPNWMSLIWMSQYAPDSSTFTPIYVAADGVPTAYTRGTMHEYNTESAWWNYAVVGNYAARFYRYSMTSVRTLQHELESTLAAGVNEVETAVLAAYRPFQQQNIGKSMTAADLAPLLEQLAAFSRTNGEMVTSRWRALFPKLLAKYRDGYILDVTTPTIGITRLFYPRFWLQATGYFDIPSNNDPKAILLDPSPNAAESSTLFWSVVLASSLSSLVTFLYFTRFRKTSMDAPTFPAIASDRYGYVAVSNVDPMTTRRHVVNNEHGAYQEL